MKAALCWERLLDQVRLEFGSAIRHECGPQWRSLPRVLPDEQLHILEAGEVEYDVAGSRFRASEGSIAFCPPGVEWSARRVSRSSVVLVVIHFQARFPGGRRYMETLGFPCPVTPSPAVFGRLLACGRRLCRLDRDRPPGHALLALALLHDFFFGFYPYRGASAPVDRDGERVLKVIEHLNTRYRDPLTLEDLGRLVAVSPNHLAALFRAYAGKSPIDFLIRLRLEQACRLLRACDLAVSEVAWEVGYEDAAYFSRLFHKHLGLSPSEFRRQQGGLL